MAIDHRELYSSHSLDTDSVGPVRRFFRELAFQDWLVFGFMVVLNFAAYNTPESAARTQSLHRMFAMLVFLSATLVVVRGGLLKHGFFAPLAYRLAIYGTVQLSYFFLAELLPLVNTTTLDAELYHLDTLLFGFEPAIAMDSIVSPVTTEWFAFFYFSYFFLLAVHVIPILMLSKNARLLGEFALGLIMVFCVGHTVYMLVPGFGPYKAMAGHFQNELPHGMWMDMVRSTVAKGGAQMDIFPSLHTAAPTFMAMFSFRHRDKLPFKYTWPVVVFFAVNIIIATMFLRWHYIIDVVAGLTLATAALLISTRLTRLEAARRLRLGTENWPTFFKRPRRTVAELVGS